ncbi:MAG: M23 family metallopeptidase [Leptolyngbyaceae bacterium]|nr:M23 family metallopeptidase [Leptolyngbyaceae bacterium]
MKRLALLAGLGIVGLIGSRFEQNQVTAQEVVPSPNIAQMAWKANWQDSSFPVENFQGYTSLYGYRSSSNGSGQQEFHTGLDLAAPSGSYIRSWMGGQVIEVSRDPICGTSVKIRSGSWVHLYCHLQGNIEANVRGRYLSDRSGNIQVWQGQLVQTGEVIGRVGMTGRTTGPHLHWELQYNNQRINPSLVLREMYQQQARSR